MYLQSRLAQAAVENSNKNLSDGGKALFDDGNSAKHPGLFFSDQSIQRQSTSLGFRFLWLRKMAVGGTEKRKSDQ